MRLAGWVEFRAQGKRDWSRAGLLGAAVGDPRVTGLL